MDRDLESTVLGYAEAAEFLNISTRTLERYVPEGLIPYIPFQSAARGPASVSCDPN